MVLDDDGPQPLSRKPRRHRRRTGSRTFDSGLRLHELAPGVQHDGCGRDLSFDSTHLHVDGWRSTEAARGLGAVPNVYGKSGVNGDGEVSDVTRIGGGGCRGCVRGRWRRAPRDAHSADDKQDLPNDSHTDATQRPCHLVPLLNRPLSADRRGGLPVGCSPSSQQSSGSASAPASPRGVAGQLSRRPARPLRESAPHPLQDFREFDSIPAGVVHEQRHERLPPTTMHALVPATSRWVMGACAAPTSRRTPDATRCTRSGGVEPQVALWSWRAASAREPVSEG